MYQRENKFYQFADGYHCAVIGTTDDGRVVYSKVAMIEKLVSEDDMTIEEAMKWCELNFWNKYIGEYTPIYINDFDADFDELNEHLNA